MHTSASLLSFALLVAVLAACSNDSSPPAGGDQGPGSGAAGGGLSGASGSGASGGGSPGQPANCGSRCEQVAAECGEDKAQCPDLCTRFTEGLLSCLEQSHCDSDVLSGCLDHLSPAGGGGSGGAGHGGGPGGGGASGGSAGSGASTACSKDLSAWKEEYSVSCLAEHCCDSAAACALDLACQGYDACVNVCFASGGSGKQISDCIKACKEKAGGQVPSAYPSFHDCLLGAPAACTKTS